MHIIGLTGPIGSGKTTFAQFLDELAQPSAHWESWQIIAEAAEDLRAQAGPTPATDDYEAINAWLQILPDVTEKVTGERADLATLRLSAERVSAQPENYAKLFDYLQVIHERPELSRLPITPGTKETFRNILQWIGGPVAATVNQAMWYQEIVRRIRRRPELALATVGGVRYPADSETLRAAGGLIMEIIRPTQVSRDLQDPTERNRNAIRADTIIVNNGSLADLAQLAGNFYTDLKAGDLRSRYESIV